VEHTEGDGGDMFKAVCKLGLEDIVSKRLDAPPSHGPSKTWIKVKNPKAPAATLWPELVRKTIGGWPMNEAHKSFREAIDKAIAAARAAGLSEREIKSTFADVVRLRKDRERLRALYPNSSKKS
jgi:hypothetical protein